MTQNTSPTNSGTSAGVYVLQWLTYTFWGWLSAALIWLTWIVLAHATTDNPSSGAVPYAIAATIVLLPLAFTIDAFYRKHEPAKKHGAASVITVIHSIIFALSSIGTLIFAVFLSLNMLIESSSDSYQTVAILTLFAAFILSGLAFLRTLNPFKTALTSQLYRYGMLAVSVLLLVFAITGPVAGLVSSRNDRRIDAGIHEIQQGITAYIETNQAHPESLQDINVTTDEARALIEDGLIDYKKGDTLPSSRINGGTQYRYELCADYAQEDTSRYRASTFQQDLYQRYLTTSGHPAGTVCYKLYATADFDSLKGVEIY